MGSILILEGGDTPPTDLATYLRARGHEVVTTAGADETLAALAHQQFDLVLLDAGGAAENETALLRDVVRAHPDVVVVFAAPHPTVSSIVEVMRAGAYDYLEKPLIPHRVELLLRRSARSGEPRYRDKGKADDSEPLLESQNPTMARAIDIARQVAESDVPVLIAGESGTGKKTLAAAIHRWSARRRGPFVTVWCATLTEHRVERRLIEHLQGAFTRPRRARYERDAALQGGTLFLDEIGGGNLPPSFQVKLVRLLEEQRFRPSDGEPDVDVRVMAASHHDLEADVRGGRLREDLFFRLNVVTIALPPLRERVEDLTGLRDHLLATLSARHGRPPMRLTAEAADALSRHHWTGNVRELMSVLERAVVLARGETIGAEDLASRLPSKTRDDSASPAPPLSLMEIEQRQIRQVLEEAPTLGEAAARLGIDPATLWRKRKRYGLDRPQGDHEQPERPRDDNGDDFTAHSPSPPGLAEAGVPRHSRRRDA